MTALSLALCFIALVGYAALRLYLSRRYTHDTVSAEVVAFKEALTAAISAKDAEVKQLREDVSFLKHRAGL